MGIIGQIANAGANVLFAYCGYVLFKQGLVLYKEMKKRGDK